MLGLAKGPKPKIVELLIVRLDSMTKEYIAVETVYFDRDHEDPAEVEYYVRLIRKGEVPWNPQIFSPRQKLVHITVEEIDD